MSLRDRTRSVRRWAGEKAPPRPQGQKAEWRQCSPRPFNHQKFLTVELPSDVTQLPLEVGTTT